MSALQSLKQRKEAEAAAVQKAQGEILTGMASTADASAAPVEVKPTVATADEITSLAKEFPGGYEMRQVKRIVLASGRVVKPNAYGVIVPKTDEEKKILEHFAEQGEHLVKPLTEGK